MLYFFRPKPLDKKKLLSPSQETLEEDRQTTPPIPITKKIRKLSPIKQTPSVAPTPAVRQVKPIPPDLMNDVEVQRQNIPNVIEDEVESDADLGLDVQYVDDKSKPSSRPPTGKSARSLVS